MARKKADTGVVTRLAERGEEAVNRLIEELGKNPRLTDALHRATAAKGKLDTATRSALTQVGLAPADDVADLRKKIEGLEKRVAKLEGGAKRPAAKRSTAAARGSRAGSARRSAPGGGTAAS